MRASRCAALAPERTGCKGSRGTVVAASCVADPTPLRTRSIGTEHEKFGFRKADKRPIDYNEVKHLLLGLVNRRVLRQSVARARRAAPPRTAHSAEHLATQVWLGAHPRKGLHHRCQA
jgi:hypothetical protein